MEKKERWQPATLSGRFFQHRKDLDAAIKAELASLPRNRRCRSDLLADVINLYHPDVKASTQIATGWFAILDADEQRRRGLDTAGRYGLGHNSPTGILVTAHFEPLGEFRPTTCYPWRKSINPEAELKKALREKIRPSLPRPTRFDACAMRGIGECSGPLEYQHIKPTFDQIAVACVALMSGREIETLFGYNKFEPGKDDLVHCIPNSHPATRRLRALHETNEWEWLCSFHHRGEGRLLPRNER